MSSKYEINLIDVPGVSGPKNLSRSFVDFFSVTGSMDLKFNTLTCEFDVYVFQIEEQVVPNWFGVVVPKGMNDFSNVHIFFHPLPGQARYVDAQYQSKGKWGNILGKYTEMLGWQFAASGRKQILIIPLLTSSAASTLGIFATDWQGIVEYIQNGLQRIYGLPETQPQIRNLMISSFSVGIAYLKTFRIRGVNVTPLLREVYDFDGKYSTYRNYAQNLTGGHILRQYDQYAVFSEQQVKQGAMSCQYHVPINRWRKHTPRPASSDTIHAYIPYYMMLHALCSSLIGV